MELKDTWIDQRDDVDMAGADVINEIANAVIQIENNKTTSISENPSNTKYPTEKAVADYVSKQGGGGSTINVIDNVDSTSQTDALSANMGRFINEARLSFQTFVSQELPKKEVSANKTTIINETSTDEQYPSAKAVYNIVGDIESALDNIIAIKNELIGGESA